MEIASKYEIAAANLALALQTDTVSAEQRIALREAVGNQIDMLVNTLNMLIVSYNRRMYCGEITPERAEKCVEAEYKAIGLSDVVSYTWFAAAVNTFFVRKAMLEMTPEKKIAQVKEIFSRNERCDCQCVKDAMNIYCLRLMSHMGIVTVDLAFTSAVMREINAITEDRKSSAIMPNALITEL